MKSKKKNLAIIKIPKAPSVPPTRDISPPIQVPNKKPFIIDNKEAKGKLHKIKKLIAINHQDCGAAKIAVNKKELNQTEEFKIHHMAFKSLKKKLKKIFPKLRLETLVIDLRGRIKNLKV